MGNKKWEMIEKLSRNSDKEGNLLLELMDRYGVMSLHVLTEEQVREYYEELKQ